MNVKRFGIKMMSVLLLLSMLLCVTACAEKKTEPSKDDEPTKTEHSIFTVEYNCAMIELGKDASTVLKKLGEPTSKQFVASCGESAGDQWQYIYSSIVLFTLKTDDKEIVDAVALRDDIGKTNKGITIGSTEAEMIAAYGEPTRQGQKCRYIEGSHTLEFQLDDAGYVKSVEIRAES